MSLSKQDRAMAVSSYTCQMLGFQVWQDGAIFLNWHADMTLRCNGGCLDCMKLLGLLPMDDPESDLTERHVEMIGKLLRSHSIRIRRLRISGGEPLLHPDFVYMLHLIREVWKPLVVRIFTNDTISFPSGIDPRHTMRPIDMEQKRIRHIPFYISPADLGMEPKHGFLDACKMSRECGRSVNVFGFTPCMQYPHIGRMLGKDVHFSRPKLLGDLEICQHCICSLPKHEQRTVRSKIVNGKIDYPTKTYREGIVREREQPTEMKSLLER